MPKNNDLWKLIVIGNIFLTLFLFWVLYSQITYLTSLVENKLPYVIPASSSYTAIVVNPFTGSFLILNFPTVLVVLMCVIVFIFLVLLLRFF
jgi:hypothetical protein